MTSKEEHEKQLAEDVNTKMEELSFAHYKKDIKQMLVICMDKEGGMVSMRAYDNIGIPHFYLILGMLQREMEQMMIPSQKPMERKD